ncbi:UbiA family prenyltransferase [Aliifodinibius halophilus]|uniref:UbiA family prenyltransferase n=1 Tax=Fodinibius halophilus TaxID=1736908 RepID=A0A6M1TC79_9BACT|nr:UbiA family prenyltransferase [Fodinibius halophilus]
MLRQCWHFILHLRWHYQLFILSGGFLLGGVLSSNLDLGLFLQQFFNVHLLLFGGATAYNSYWDKDEGPIGGLANPPKMERWMWGASIALQLAGLFLAIPAGGIFIAVYGISMLFFWLYSTPLARWKSRPIKSLIAIGISTGFNSVLLGYLAAGNGELAPFVLIAALGVTLMLLSLYPISQIYQQEEDRNRGDQTFAIQYGRSGVLHFFEGAFFSGLLLVTGVFYGIYLNLAISFGIIGVCIGLWVRFRIKKLSAKKDDYKRVMQLKYSTSIGFVIFLLCILLLKHIPEGGISGVADLLLR